MILLLHLLLLLLLALLLLLLLLVLLLQLFELLLDAVGLLLLHDVLHEDVIQLLLILDLGLQMRDILRRHYLTLTRRGGRSAGTQRMMRGQPLRLLLLLLHRFLSSARIDVNHVRAALRMERCVSRVRSL